MRLSAILVSVERSMEAASRLDAHASVCPAIGDDHEGLLDFNARLTFLEQRIDRELDVLTAEGLRADLAEKQLAMTKGAA